MYDIEGPQWSLGIMDEKVAQFIALMHPEDVLEPYYEEDDPIIDERLRVWIEAFEAQVTS